MKKLETIAEKFLLAAGLLLFALLTAASFVFTRYFAEDFSTELPYSRSDLFFWAAAGAVLLGGLIVWLSGKIADGSSGERKKIWRLETAVLLWCFFAGVLWVILAKSTPVSDQLMVSTSAERFLEGNYGRFEYGKYLYYYPFQLGLAAFEEFVYRIFGSGNYTAFQILNAAGVTASVFAGSRITELLFQKSRAQAAYLLLSACCFPLFIFCAYLYGDVLSICLSMLVIWQMLVYLKTGKKRAVFFMVLSGAAAVLLRGNSLIVLIAVCCVLAVKALAEKKGRYLLCILLLAAGVAGSRFLLNTGYEKASGTKLNEGMPSILWIAMGMQEGDKEAGWYNGYSVYVYQDVCAYEEELAAQILNEGMPSILWIAMGMQEGDKEAGWYNGYSVYVYQDVCAYEEELAAQIGKEEIKARGKEFLRKPLYGTDFYARKFSSQWAEPTYGSFIMTYATEKERSAVGESLYTGFWQKLLERFMDSYQLLVYAAVLFLLLCRWKTKKQESLEWYVLLISIIGGVLFHMLWEAKSRYVLPYFILMIPMAAGGLAELSGLLEKRRTKDERQEGAEGGR